MNLVASIVSAALLMGSLGCADRESEASGTPDAAIQPLTLRAGFHGLEGEPLHLIDDGDMVPIRIAAQGGYAMFIGARLDGIEPSLATLQAELVNPQTAELFVTDSRVIELMTVADAPGFLEPDSRNNSQFAHLIPCPNYGARRVHGLEWILNVAVNVADHHAGQISVRVTPICAPGSRYEACLCECEPGYVFAKCGAPH